MTEAYPGQERLPSATSDYNQLDFIIRQIAGRMCTATLVQVLAVGEGTVDVQPMVHQVDGAGGITPHGKVHALPVWQLQGGAAAVIVRPVVGDIGLAVFAREDLTGVRATRKPAAPGSRRRYSYSDGIYLGGVLNMPPTTSVTLDPSGTVTVVAPTGVVLDTPMLTVTGDIQTGAGSTFNGVQFDSHTHSGVQSGSATSGPPSK
jgi:hypothetical protein